MGKSDRLLLNLYFTETFAEVIHCEHVSEVDDPAHVWLVIEFDCGESLDEISSFDVWVNVLDLISLRLPAHLIVGGTDKGTHDVGVLGEVDAELDEVDQLTVIRDEVVIGPSTVL